MQDHAEELLSDVLDAIQKYCVLPTDHDYIAVTLWCAYTHFIPAFDEAPRLVARSPQKGSGKTRLLEIIGEIVHNPLRNLNATPSALFRSLGNPTTVIFDEVDALFGTRAKAEQNEDLRAIINGGFNRGYPVRRTEGPDRKVVAYEVFNPAALAGIGRLPDTIEDRAVVIPMRKRAPGEKVDSYRPRRDKAALNALRDRLAAWAAGVQDAAEKKYADESVDMPVDDRPADVWEPLLIVAELAGEDWAEIAREACKYVCARAADDDADYGVGQQLLADAHTLSREMPDPKIGATDMVTRLRVLPESQWVDLDLTPHKLAKYLRDYGIKSRSDGRLRCYYWADFHDAWSRYLRIEVSKPSEPSEAPIEQQECLDTSTDTLTPKVSTDTSDSEMSGQVSDDNPSSEHVSDPSDTLDAYLPFSDNLTAEQRTRVARALERAKK